MRSPSAKAPSASVRGKAGGAGTLGAALEGALPASEGATTGTSGSTTRLTLGWFEACLPDELHPGKPTRTMVKVKSVRLKAGATFESGVFDGAFMSKMASYDHGPRVAR